MLATNHDRDYPQEMSVHVETMGNALPFATFWVWLRTHCNCIVRAGGKDTVIYDFDDLHWHLEEDNGGKLIVQVIRGKNLAAELIITRQDVEYVEYYPSAESQGHYEFQLLGGGNPDQITVQYQFLMAHGYEESSSQKSVSH